jgi:hypothetical protein
VAGIVLFAFALKATLAHVGDKLDTIAALGLCGGPALYLFAYVALRLRVSRTLGRGRLVAAIACALLLPIALVVPALSWRSRSSPPPGSHFTRTRSSGSARPAHGRAYCARRSPPPGRQAPVP